jgi:hypothetical protein
MPNLVKFFVSAPTNTGDTKSIIKDNVDLSVPSIDYGPTSRTGYFNGTNPPNSGYTIYNVSGASFFSASSVDYLTVAAGVSGIYAMQADESYLYACRYVSPGVVVRVPVPAFNSFTTKTLAVGENNLNAIALDGNYVYVGTETTTGRVIRILKSDFNTTTTLTLSAGTGPIYSMVIDDSTLYCLLFASPSRVVKVSLSTFTVTDTKIFPTGGTYNDAYCMTQDKDYLYIGFATTTGSIARLSKSDFNTTSILTFSGASAAVDIISISVDDDFIYAGTANSSGSKILRVRKSTFTEVTPQISWPSEGDGWYGLNNNQPYIYGGYSSTSVPKCVVFNKLNFVSAGTISFTSSTQVASSTIDKLYLYFGTLNNKIVRTPTFTQPTYFTADNDTTALSGIQKVAGTGVMLSSISQALTYVASGMPNTIVINKAYPNIVTSGMVLNIDSRFIPSYPGSSTRWYDISGNNYLSNMTNGTIPYNTQYPQYFDYSNTPSYFEGNNSLASKVKSGVTVTCWAIQTSGNSRSVYLDKYRNAVLQGYVFEGGTATGNWTATTRFYAQGTDQFNAVDFRGQNGVIQTNRPYMLTVTFDYPSRSCKLYINQNEISTTEVGGGTPAGLSSDWSQSPNFWQTGSYRPDFATDSFMRQYGLMIYDRALSATEISQNYYQGPIVTSGLTIAADASNIVSYVGTGTSWYNLVVTGSTGTTFGTPTFKSDNGGAFSFDGVNNYADFGGTYSGTSTGSLTYSCWIKTPATNVERYFVIRGRDGFGAGSSVRLGTNSSNAAVFSLTFTSPGISTVTATSSEILSNNTWYHLTGVYNSLVNNTIQIYVNGGLRGSTTTEATVLRESTSGIIIGSLSASLFYQFHMSSFLVYNRALSSTEVTQNYLAFFSRFN